MPIVMNRISDPRIVRGMEKQLRLRQVRLDAGHRPIGWKVGFGAPAALERLRLDAPLIGFLTDKTVLPSNATVSIADWTKPAMEAEIAVYMGKDLPAGADRKTTQAAIASIGPAIELADMHFPPDDVEAVLAANIYNRHVILGRADSSREGCVLNGLTGHISHNGEALSPVTALQALTGDLIDIVSHVADVLAKSGETLRSGELIITGSIIPPLWIRPRDRIQYQLEPIDTIAVVVA